MENIFRRVGCFISSNLEGLLLGAPFFLYALGLAEIALTFS